jgi:hypothetical protein
MTATTETPTKRVLWMEVWCLDAQTLDTEAGSDVEALEITLAQWEQIAAILGTCDLMRERAAHLLQGQEHPVLQAQFDADTMRRDALARAAEWEVPHG